VLDANWSVDSGGSDYAWVYLHQGGRYDAVARLYHFRHRDFSPSLGRWVQQDPAGYVDGASLYQYVASAPVALVDPLGLFQVPGSLIDGTSTAVPRGSPALFRAGVAGGAAFVGIVLGATIYYTGAGEYVGIAGYPTTPVGHALGSAAVATPAAAAMASLATPLNKDACPKRHCVDAAIVEDHHIATKYPNLRRFGYNLGGRFGELLGTAGVDVNQVLNPDGTPATNGCPVCDVGDGRTHKGPHPAQYHQIVMNRLQAALQQANATMPAGLTPQQQMAHRRRAVDALFNKICKEINTQGTVLRNLVTK
jgi:RHS repeat-associated protein